MYCIVHPPTTLNPLISSTRKQGLRSRRLSGDRLILLHRARILLRWAGILLRWAGILLRWAGMLLRRAGILLQGASGFVLGIRRRCLGSQAASGRPVAVALCIRGLAKIRGRSSPTKLLDELCLGL